MNTQKISNKLSNPENWNEELVYVHRTRIIFGLILGFILGFLLAFGIFTK